MAAPEQRVHDAGAVMLLRIHHAAILCADFAASKRFYVETLGLRVVADVVAACKRKVEAAGVAV
jgi:catechol-2,3-dioxygenase